jgi:hypothetical protein
MSEVHKEAAKRRGQARTAGVELKVREAMVAIQNEMAANGGIYPANGGAISMNEVARRAGISETTLFAPRQKELGRVVKAWVDSLKTKEVVGRMRVRRTVFERSEDWRKQYLALQDQHILLELELQDAQVELENERKKTARLTEQNEALLQQLRVGAAGKVTAIPAKGKR